MFSELLREEVWRRRLEDCGFRVIAAPLPAVDPGAAARHPGDAARQTSPAQTKEKP